MTGKAGNRILFAYLRRISGAYQAIAIFTNTHVVNCLLSACGEHKAIKGESGIDFTDAEVLDRPRAVFTVFLFHQEVGSP